KTVQKIGKKKDGWHPFVIQRGKDKDETNDKKARDGSFRFPIDRLEAWIAKTAEHHERKKEHQWRQNPSPSPQLMFAFREPQHKEGDRRNHSGCGCDGKAGKVLCLFRGRNTALFGRYTVVARQS